MTAALGLLTSCDPSKESIDMPGNSGLTSEQLSNGFSFTQYGDEEYTTEAADGNYFTFFTSPSRVVTIYQLDAEGERTDLFTGATNGKFKIVPKRGNPTSQTFYIETKDMNGNTITGERTVNVFVPQELTPEMRLLASDAYGSKTWKWDTAWRADGGTWGNLGYAPGDGESFVNEGNGIWWACPPADLEGQLGHSDTGVATGEESPNASMVIADDGTITCYDAGGNQIRKGKITSVDNYTGQRNIASIDGSQANWSYGTLNTTAGSILFPFKINGGGEKPTAFEIMQLDANNLKLIYAAPGTGGWGEATWWAFTSNSDPEAALTNFGSQSWTWDTTWREDGGAWGNLGDNGDGAGWTGGIWWACPPADLTGQLNHSDTGVATGEEDPNAYMTFDWKSGTVTSYDAAGTQIRKGAFEISSWNNGDRNGGWELGKLTTDAGSILFPFKINGGGTKPTEFDIMKLDNQLQLIYSEGAHGGWGEATWWAFKKK